MSAAEWTGIGLAAAMFLVMLLGWLGLYPKAFNKVLTKRKNSDFNWLAILLTACVGAIIYLAVAEKEIPLSLYIITLFILTFGAVSRSKPSK